MKKMINKKALAICVAAAAFFVLPLSASAAEKLVVKNTLGGKAFTVDPDVENNYNLNILGHTGGTSHAQIVTGLTNSRLTIMANDAQDFAPRIHFVGPADSNIPFRSSALFEFGSNIYDMPDASFSVRHWAPGYVITTAMEITKNKVLIPTANVGIGTAVPNSKLQVTGGYIQLDISSGIPPASDCLASKDYGRMKVDPASTGTLWICTATGWNGK